MMINRHNRIQFPLLLAFLFAACRNPNIPAQAVMPLDASFTPTLNAPLAETPASTHPSIWTRALQASRVLILSIDGLRPDAIALAPMPNLTALMESGAYSLSAQTVYPSVTLPSHVSMLTGSCPSKHGVDWNEYDPEKGYAKGTDLFDLAHAGGMQTAIYVGKDKLRHIVEPSSADIFVYENDGDLAIVEKLVADFPQDFNVLFAHFPTPDRTGHKHGWLSRKQLSAIRDADEALGHLLAELETRGLREGTLIIVSADHGGHGFFHGTTMPEDMTIPWIAAGPGIQPGQLTTQVYTMDTAATAAYALGLDIPAGWDGTPVYEAFGLPAERGSTACQG